MSVKTAAVEQINAASAAVLASVEADIESIEAIEELLAGGEPGEPPPPGGPDLTRGRLYHCDVPITAPFDLAPGQLLGLKAIAMVVKVNVTTGRHRKFVGAASSQVARSGRLRHRAEPAGRARHLAQRRRVQPDRRPARVAGAQGEHAGVGRRKPGAGRPVLRGRGTEPAGRGRRQDRPQRPGPAAGAASTARPRSAPATGTASGSTRSPLTA